MDSRIRNLNYEGAPTGTTLFIVDDASYTNAEYTTLTDVKDYILDGYSSDNTFTTGQTFDTNTGILNNYRNDGGIYFVDLDGRYALSGSTGTSGTSGVDGASGSTGASGTDGTSGTSGTDGGSGSSGTDGTDGALTGITTDSNFYYLNDVLYTPWKLI